MKQQHNIPLPPHSIEAEEAVLGGIIYDSESRWDVFGYLKPEHFWITRHQMIYRAIQRLSERGDAIDYLTVVEELRARKVVA